MNGTGFAMPTDSTNEPRTITAGADDFFFCCFLLVMVNRR